MTPLIQPAEPGTPAGLSAVVRIVAWEDELLDALGIDPRSRYVERFWLPVLGPSATWLLRRMADGLSTSPGGFDLGLEDAARSLGLGGVGSRHSPFQRAILRCTRYGIARHVGPDVLGFRRRLWTVPQRLVDRFPPPLRAEHSAWMQEHRRPADLARTRRSSRLLALDLVAVERSIEGVERRLLAAGVHPALCSESAQWAWDVLRRSGSSVDAAITRS